MQHVLDTVASSRPSLGPKEREQMFKRYEKFMQSREGGGQSPFSAAGEQARQRNPQQQAQRVVTA